MDIGKGDEVKQTREKGGMGDEYVRL